MKTRRSIFKTSFRAGFGKPREDDASLIEDIGITAAFQDALAPRTSTQIDADAAADPGGMESRLTAARSIA